MISGPAQSSMSWTHFAIAGCACQMALVTAGPATREKTAGGMARSGDEEGGDGA